MYNGVELGDLTLRETKEVRHVVDVLNEAERRKLSRTIVSGGTREPGEGKWQLRSNIGEDVQTRREGELCKRIRARR